jgi:DtxR family Mn-dependent transcriptional regulator
MKLSISEENHIKAIYHLQSSMERVGTKDLAARLKTKPASVTDMMKRLKIKRLIDYKPYYGFKLSAEGKRVALTIVRRHRLWEYFLVEKLQFDWDEVHELAEELEHVRSPLLIERLDTYLNRPKFDPHGDPIPDREGNFSKEDAVPLTILKANQKGKVSRITKNNKEVIDLIMLKHIRKGSRIEIKRIFTIDGSIELKVDNKYVEHISPLLAQNILIEHENGKK